MSAPPVPDNFGNYALGEFAEVVSPAAVSWLPQTAGWWWLGLFALGVIGHYGWQHLRRWYRDRYRREAVQRLRLLAASAQGSVLVAEANKLLKLAAMVAYSREEVASLSGEDWVAFLERRCPGQVFSPDQARLLAVGAYRADALTGADGQGLIDACQHWVQNHRPVGDD